MLGVLPSPTEALLGRAKGCLWQVPQAGLEGDGGLPEDRERGVAPC